MSVGSCGGAHLPADEAARRSVRPGAAHLPLGAAGAGRLRPDGGDTLLLHTQVSINTVLLVHRVHQARCAGVTNVKNALGK